jgi:hypothetical protein
MGRKKVRKEGRGRMSRNANLVEPEERRWKEFGRQNKIERRTEGRRNRENGILKEGN